MPFRSTDADTPTTPGGVRFWRHPRVHAADGRCIGRTDLPVDPRRARRLARRIDRDACRAGLPRVVVTSPLRRCADVGRALRRLGWHHRIDAALVEADFGDWDGRAWSAIGAEAVDAWSAALATHRPGGGESVATLSRRVGNWRPPEDLGVVVGHAGWIGLRRWRAIHGEALPTAATWPAALPHGHCWIEAPAEVAGFRARRERAAIAWSGGKDSMLALLEARCAGLDVDTFVTMLDADGTSKSHALPPAVVEAQVRALGGRWIGVRVPDEPGAYAWTFDAALATVAADGIGTMVFGDIDLQAHRDWLAPRCAAAGLAARFPLWGRDRRELATAVWAAGIRARLVVVDTARLDASFCGRAFDEGLLRELPADVCPCGEDGEFHTLVCDGPGFAAPLAVACDGIDRRPPPPGFRPTELAVLRVALADTAA